MITVLEHGSKKVSCPYCKAKLQYEHEDIQTERRSADFMFDEDSEYEFIVCPDCHERIILTPLKR